jgi:hypothetical protein
MSRRKTKGTSEYQLQSSLKNKPNAQGTLFSGGELSQSRYPRGYTPERFAETVSHFGKPDIGYGTDLSGMRNNAYYAHQMLQNFARSNIDFQQNPEIARGYKDTPDQAHGPMLRFSNNMGARGTYTPSGVKGNAGRLDMSPAAIDSYTPIHEYGHFIDRQNIWNSEETPKERGRREGVADQYAENNFRTRRGKTQEVRGTPSKWDKGYGNTTPQRSKQFRDAYWNARESQGMRPLSEQYPDVEHEQGELF